MEKNVTFEQMKELIELATNHGWFDYIAVTLSSIVPVIAIFVSLLIFQRRITQVAQEKVIEKDVEKFYEIVEYFFEYSDTANLYFSLQLKSFEKKIYDKILEDSFSEKLKKSTDEFFNQFEKVRRASFLLKALGEIDAANEVDAYREKTIRLRKDILDIEGNYKNNNDKTPFGDFYKELEQRKKSLEIVRDNCLNEIASCKSRLKTFKPPKKS